MYVSYSKIYSKNRKYLILIVCTLGSSFLKRQTSRSEKEDEHLPPTWRLEVYNVELYIMMEKYLYTLWLRIGDTISTSLHYGSRLLLCSDVMSCDFFLWNARRSTLSGSSFLVSDYSFHLDNPALCTYTV
jgi:hypothetical protein